MMGINIFFDILSNQGLDFLIKIILKHFLFTLETFELVFFVENECELLVKVY